MKKIILCLLSAVVLASCTSRFEETKVSEIKSIQTNINGHVVQIDIAKITYDGHSYIMFDGSKYLNGIVHDPDCACHKHDSSETDFGF